MKKKPLSIFLAVILVLSLAVSVSASSNTISKDITYRNIKITLYGAELTPTDVNGNPTEPFIMDGSTYLPVRAIAEAMGLEVGWDDATSTVILSAPQTQATSTSEPASDPTSQPTQDRQAGSGGNGNGDNFYTHYNTDKQNTEDTYVLNTKTMKIHTPSCSSVAKIAPENYATTNKSIQELEAEGYERCGMREEPWNN